MNTVDRPHDSAVEMIIAATGADVRRSLAELIEHARFGVRAVAEDPAALAALLRDDPHGRAATDGRAVTDDRAVTDGVVTDTRVVTRDCVVTGGELHRARPYLQAARGAGAAVIAVIAGRTETEDREDLGYRGLALLRTPPTTHRFQAATAAARAGLNVWDPDLEFPAENKDPVATPLSPRERTVLALTGAGLSNKSVALELGISPNTVKFHLQAAFAKLGVSSRAQAVMAAIRRGELAV